MDCLSTYIKETRIVSSHPASSHLAPSILDIITTNHNIGYHINNQHEETLSNICNSIMEYEKAEKNSKMNINSSPSTSSPISMSTTSTRSSNERMTEPMELSTPETDLSFKRSFEMMEISTSSDYPDKKLAEMMDTLEISNKRPVDMMAMWSPEYDRPNKRLSEEFGPDEEMMNFMKVSTNFWRNVGNNERLLYIPDMVEIILCRKRLMEKLGQKDMGPDERCMLFCLLSFSKNRNRLLKQMDRYPARVRSGDLFQSVKAFVESELPECVYQPSFKMPKVASAIDFPALIPGLDILCWIRVSHYEDINTTNLFRRETAGNLDLNESCNCDAKKIYTDYWVNVEKNKKNKKSREPKTNHLFPFSVNQRIHHSPPNEKHWLLTVNINEIPPGDVGSGYGMAEIIAYLLYAIKVFKKLPVYNSPQKDDMRSLSQEHIDEIESLVAKYERLSL